MVKTALAHGGTPARSQASLGGGTRGWIVGAYVLPMLEKAGASSSLLKAAFDNAGTYVFGAAATVGVPMADYQSYQKISAAFANGTLPGRYKALMYDNEHWSYTPLAEQEDPSKYENLVADLAHRYGMLFIAAPAADIVRASGTVVDNSTQQTYLARDIAGNAARYADVIDIQAQYLEPNAAKFANFVKTAAAQARTANPKVKVYVGLATGPDGQIVSESQLYGALRIASDYANGYWLNISGKGGYCPNCSAPKPELAVKLLQRLYP